MKQKHDFYEAYKRRRELEEENARLKQKLASLTDQYCDCSQRSHLCCFCTAAQGVYNVRR